MVNILVFPEQNTAPTMDEGLIYVYPELKDSGAHGLGPGHGTLNIRAFKKKRTILMKHPKGK